MAFYINNRSAMLFWCMVTTSLEDVVSLSKACDLSDSETAFAHIDEKAIDDFAYGSEKKIHLLVGDNKQRTQSPRLVYHLHQGPFPKGAFLRYSPNILVASPELCFLEMALELPFFKLVEFGFLLCGTYTVNPDARDPNRRKQLSSKRRIEAFIESMRPERGCVVALRALSFVVEGSASPRETKTAILLCMPIRLGGYGFEKPLMNYRVDFTEKEQRLFGKPYVVLDLYWPDSNFGIEYDGGDNHTEETDVSRDRRKNSELNYRGINVIRVDKDQLKNPFEVYVLAKKCARAMKKPFRKPTAKQQERKAELFNATMGTRHKTV